MHRPLSRRGFIGLSGASLAALALAACGGSGDGDASVATIAPLPDKPTPAQARAALEAGNARWVAGKSVHPDTDSATRQALVAGQAPLAVVVGCVDSRVPPELVFDRGLGDLLTVRNAGHVVDTAALGSVQLGVTAMGIPLIVVLGHNKCGAVATAISAVEKGASSDVGGIDALITAIKPAVAETAGKTGDRTDVVERAHTERTVKLLRDNAELASYVKSGALAIVGAEYDLATGKVTFLD